MKTTEIFADNNHDILRKALRNFTVKSEGADGVGSSSWISTEFSYNDNDWYSVNVDESRDEENICGNLFITVYKCHPEWGVSIIAENDCHYDDWGERTEILARELTECIGIIEMD